MKILPGVELDDFVSYLPVHNYIFLPTREPWPAASVNSQFPGGIILLDENDQPVLSADGEPVVIKASAWLDQNNRVHQMTWAPGLPMIIKDKIVAEGGWIERPESRCLNLYRPPRVELGKASLAKPWLAHVRRVYPHDAGHIVYWLAHRVQRPQDKINHALVLGGNQGIGKDTLLAPVKYCIGPWNFIEVSPTQMLGRFNGYLKSVILRVSEARDLGESNRFVFYEHLKNITAAPPDVLRVDEKNLREHSILNVCGVVITTNHKSDGLYLPADDRRHYVAWSTLCKDDFNVAYWNDLWGWYGDGGEQHVAAYLSTLDLKKFEAKAPPLKTEAWWLIVNSNRSPEDAELADALDSLANPAAVTLDVVSNKASMTLAEWMDDRRNRRIIPHRMENCGYVPVRNKGADDGLWKVNGARQVVYAKRDLPLRDQLGATHALIAAAAKKQRDLAKNGGRTSEKPHGGQRVKPGIKGVRFD